jgi:hypothetical protein
MTLEISKIDRLPQVLEDSPENPVYLVDEDGQATHVVISAESYLRLQALLEPEPFDVRETYAAQSQALSKIWDDPELDLYNDYDQHRLS